MGRLFTKAFPKDTRKRNAGPINPHAADIKRYITPLTGDFELIHSRIAQNIANNKKGPPQNQNKSPELSVYSPMRSPVDLGAHLKNNHVNINTTPVPMTRERGAS